MTTGADSSLSLAASSDRWRRWRRCGHGLALAVVGVGLLVVLVRPTAPAIGDPLVAAHWFDEGFRDLARAYNEPRDLAAVLALGVRVAFALGLAASPPGRWLVTRVASRWRHRPWLGAAVVAGGALVALDVLLSPIAFWSGFIHDGAFGLRTQGFGGWLRDWVVLRVPGWMGAVIVAGVGYALAGRFPHSWPPLLALAGAVVVAAVVMAGPVVLEPLRHDTTRLGDGPIREAVADVAERAGLPLDDVRIADASRRTVRENAYVSGLGATRRVVLYDTLVAARSPGEIRAVVAHEVAHQQNRDIERGTLGAAAAVVVGVYALAWWLRRRTRRGQQRDVADPSAAGVVVAAALLVSVLSTPVEAVVSRQMEAAADWEALHLTGDPSSYEQLKIEMARTNLSRPDPPAWRQVWWGTHPAPVERLTMAERWRQHQRPERAAQAAKR